MKQNALEQSSVIRSWLIQQSSSLEDFDRTYLQSVSHLFCQTEQHAEIY